MAWYSGLFGSDSLGGKLSFGIGSWLNDISGQSSSAKKQYQNELKLQQQAQNFNANQAQIERSWQEQMSNTAHQRAVSDLQAAGLNPVLASGGGADANAGATASSGIGSASAGNSPTDMLTNIVGMLNSSKQTEAIVDKTKSEIENIDADTKGKEITNSYLPQVTQSMIDLNNATSAKNRQEKLNLVAQEQYQYLKNEILTAEKDINFNKMTVQQKKENVWKTIKNQEKILEIQAEKIGINNTEWKKSWDITMGMINDFVSSWSPLTETFKGGNEYNFTQSAPTVNY